MAVAESMISNSAARKINIVCLLAAILLVLILPLKKEIWYDESISIRCSKGISHDTPLFYANTNQIGSEAFSQLNTAGNVFNATVLDNGNSFLYNITLHWFTMIFGNSIAVYMLLSKLCAIGTLIAFYMLCSLFFKDSIFTSLAIILLATDNDFAGMSHEIRAYSMGILFVTLAAIYFFKFLDQKESPRHLFLAGLFSAGAILSHFLSIYVVLVFLGVLLVIKKGKLFSGKNIPAIMAPVVLLVVFFYFSYKGVQMMSNQNHKIQERSAAAGFSAVEAVQRSIKFTAINYKAVFPAFGNRPFAGILSLAFIVLLYIAGVRISKEQAERRNLHILFLFGIFGSLFLLLLSVKSQHYTALYYRYYSFCIPFCCLFIAYLLYVLFKQPAFNSLIKGSLVTIVLLPSCSLFVFGLLSAKPVLAYNHVAVAQQIAHDGIDKAGVSDWEDALLLQCFLPNGYKINYVRDQTEPYFALYKTGGLERIPVIKHN